MSENWIKIILENYWPRFLQGTLLTLELALVGTGIGLLIGLLVGVVRSIPLRKNGNKGITPRVVLLKIVDTILAVYIEVFRGTPMMVQAVLLYYGATEAFGINIPKMMAGFLVISLNTGAYMAEIVRGGIQSVPIGQTEAAKALGMTHWKTMLFVVLPQTLRNILPSIGNEFIVNIKDSSVLNIIGVLELFFMTKEVYGVYYRMYEPFLITAAIYLTLTIIFSRLLRLLEKKMDGPKNFSLSSSTTVHSMKRRHGADKPKNV